YSIKDILSILTTNLNVTFKELGDTLPEGRRKLIFSVGAVAKAKFIKTNNSPYTGILEGSNNMLIRLSVAREPKVKEITPQSALGNFIPGMSIKFLVDGLPSTNLVALQSTSGQESWNFFKQPLTSQFDISENQDLTTKLIDRKFSTVTNYISTM